VLNDVPPYTVTLQGLSVTDDNKTVLGASQGDIDSAVAVQESNTLLIITSDCRHYHEFFFTPLPAVDGLYVFFNAQGLHLALDLKNLALIRCDEAEFLNIVLSLLFQILE